MTLELIKDLGLIFWPVLISLISGLIWLIRIQGKITAVSGRVDQVQLEIRDLTMDFKKYLEKMDARYEKFYDQIIGLEKQHSIQATTLGGIAEEIREMSKYIKQDGFERLRRGLVDDISLKLKDCVND